MWEYIYVCVWEYIYIAICGLSTVYLDIWGDGSVVKNWWILEIVWSCEFLNLEIISRIQKFCLNFYLGWWVCCEFQKFCLNFKVLFCILEIISMSFCKTHCVTWSLKFYYCFLEISFMYFVRLNFINPLVGFIPCQICSYFSN